MLGFLSGEAGSKLPDIANALCSCLSLPANFVTRASGHLRRTESHGEAQFANVSTTSRLE